MNESAAPRSLGPPERPLGTPERPLSLSKGRSSTGSDRTVPPTSPRGVGNLRGRDKFPVAARRTLADTQLRRNLGKATSTIRTKRAAAVAELEDWEALRAAGSQIKARTMATLPEQLERLEASVTRAGDRKSVV